MIAQETVFEKYKFIKHVFENGRNGKHICYESPDEWFYRLEYRDHSYVIVCIDDKYYASLNALEDEAVFHDGIPEDELYRKICDWIERYAIG